MSIPVGMMKAGVFILILKITPVRQVAETGHVSARILTGEQITTLPDVSEPLVIPVRMTGG